MKGWGALKLSNRGKDQIYLKIERGVDAFIHVLDKEPESFGSHWDQNRTFICQGLTCELCRKDVKRVQRYAINVYDLETKSVRVFEFGSQIGKQLASFAEAYNDDLSQVDFKIKKEGEKLNTRYTIIPIVPSKFTPALMEGKKTHDLIALIKSRVVELEDEKIDF
jgi:hypothetical protein